MSSKNRMILAGGLTALVFLVFLLSTQIGKGKKRKDAIFNLKAKIEAQFKEKGLEFKKEEGDFVKYSLKLEEDESLIIEDEHFEKKLKEEKEYQELSFFYKEKEEIRIEISIYSLPKLAILIDDVGRSTTMAEEFIKIKEPLNFATIPFLRKSKEASKILKDAGHTVILHMPLSGSNERLNTRTKGLLNTKMSKKQIKEKFDKALESVGDVDGFNNHMGSKFTANKEKMTYLLDYAKEKSLFYVDSRTTSKSVGYSKAKELKIETYFCSVFLDNKKEVEYIKEQIKKSVKKAKKNGKCLTIGHYHPKTKEAIAGMLDYIKLEGVKLVYLKDVLE